MWIFRADLLEGLRRTHPYRPPRKPIPPLHGQGRLGAARRAGWGQRRPAPTAQIALTGLIIGALAGLTWIELAAPGSAAATLHAVNPKTWLDERQAKLNARIPPGGFRSCDQAKAAGFGRIWAGEPAYRPWLDKDGDGKACEWDAGLFD